MSRHGRADLAPGGLVYYAAQRGAYGDLPVLHVSGEIDISTSEKLRGDLQDVLEGSGDVVLDLTEVTFFDSAGLHVFDDCFTTARRNGYRIPVVCSHERVLRLFQITGLDGKYPIFGTVEAAASALADGAG